MADALSLPFKKEKDGKERLVSLSIDKVILITYFSYYLLNEAIRNSELADVWNSAALLISSCFTSVSVTC